MVIEAKIDTESCDGLPIGLQNGSSSHPLSKQVIVEFPVRLYPGSHDSVAVLVSKVPSGNVALPLSGFGSPQSNCVKKNVILA